MPDTDNTAAGGRLLRPVVIALAMMAVGSAAEAGGGDPWLGEARTICLAPANRAAAAAAFAARPAGNVADVRIMLAKSRSETGPGMYDANIRLRFSDNDRQYSMSMTCGPAKGDGPGLLCNVPCGGDAALGLSIAAEGRAVADILVDTGLLADTKATGPKGEVLDLRRLDAEDCLAAGPSSNPPGD
mgnify:CR=1 FL=1|jgi:hypothetical protein